MGMFDFLAVSRAVRNAADQIRSLRAETEKLRRQRDELSTAPAARSDVKAEFKRYAKAKAADFDAALQRAAATVAAPAAFAKIEGEPNQIRDANYFHMSGRGEGQHPLDGMLASLAPDMVEALIDRAVNAAPWPGPEGLPRAERQAAIAKLDVQIAELLKQERDLVAEARSAGILLPEV